MKDLKPGNILIDANGNVRIADFGLSRESKLAMTRNTCSLNYRAPELLYGYHQYTDKVDIWSAGCTFAELVTLSFIYSS